MKTCPYCSEEIQDQAIKCKHCGELLDGSSRPVGGPAGVRKQLFRSRSDRMLAGVCGGLAVYAAMDATMVRLLAALIIFLSGILPGLIGYVIMAVVIPEEE